jgi:serine/threonine protein kinase/WD40 repeat protein
MVKCNSCLAMLPDHIGNGICPKCGVAISAPTSAKTVSLNDVTVDSTLDLEVGPDLPKTTSENESENNDVDRDLSRTVGFQGATVVGTVDLDGGASSAKTKVDETFDEGPRKDDTTSAGDATLDVVSLDADLAKLAQTDATHATIGLVADQKNISPMATISFGTSGITVGNSAAPAPQLKGTHVAGSKRTAGASKTAGNTAGKTGQGGPDTSIDFGRSVLSTISKRTLAEKAGPLATPPDYEIVNKLGEGGMGVVYSAIQKTLDRKVAIKAIKAGKATSEESQRKFFYEAQITSDLDHPNIVPIHEMGSDDDGTLFYSMKMVDGTPWEDAILTKTRDENIEILMKVCDAVAFAHSRNIIHRDLKPENVMLGAFGEVLVMDWGLAVNLDTTQKFGMSGTPVYMAPEMAKHDLSKIGKASDIYILGGILFQIIVGKAPHKGKTVRECIANAIQNINIDPGMEDPLLDIANHAMATEPEDRYGSVTEFQDAIRQHLRHSQSIALTYRAEELLQRSIREKDYQGFSRALFSMQDAIELWPDNQAAKEGLHRTRLAYGQCALDRSDYDLCLQIVDNRIEAEAALHALATERKAEIVQREKRFKLLRQALAAVILFAVVSLTIATLYAWRQEALAMESAKSERSARENESAAKHVAEEERDKAKQAQLEEAAAREKEEAAKRLAQDERDKARKAQANEKEAKDLEVMARKEAVASEQLAKASEQKAKESAEIAKQEEQKAIRNARIAQLGKYQSELNLALNQTNQFDISRSNQLLQEIQAIEKSLISETELQDSQRVTSGPILQNWAFRRISMLNNVDQPSVHFNSPVTAFQIATKWKRGIAGTRSGRLSLIDLGDGNATLIPASTLDLRAPIHAVAISPDGEEAIIATGAQLSDYSVYHWNTKSSEAVPIRSMGKRNLQQLAISPNGQWAIGGINAGLWKWLGSDHGFESNPSLLESKGSLLKLQFNADNEDEVFGLSRLPNGKSICILANLRTDTVQSYALPDSIANRVSIASMAFAEQKFFLGLDDGRLLIAALSSGSSKKLDVLTIDSEVQPKKHTTAIRGIEVHADGTVLTFSEEPVIHVWKSALGASNLNYASFLVGLIGNVSNAKFLIGSEDIVAADDLGNVMRWNVVDQDNRRMQSDSTESQLVAQTISPDGTHSSVDFDGVIRLSRDNKAEAFYIGHTPGAKVTDLTMAAGRPLVATVARLLKSGERVVSEVCIWDYSTRTMLHRSQHEAAGACRLSFVHNDEYIVVGDGKETITISLVADYRVTKEKRFGTRIVVAHPTQPSIAAWIAPSGAVRIVDSMDPQKWEDMRYRNFDIAINNRFEPIEAAWSMDGKRLFVLFEQGRIARLEWDGASLSNLNWSDEMSILRSIEQETPWRYTEFLTKLSNNDRDSLFIELGSSESKAKSVRMRMDWGRSESKPGIPSSQSTPLSERTLETDRKDFFDIARTQAGVWIAADSSGTLTVSTPKEPSFQLGRPPCIKVSQSTDGKRWATIHEGGCILFTSISDQGAIEWHPLRHPFAEVVQAEVSPDGSRLAVVGKQAGIGVRPRDLYCFDLSGKFSVEPGIYRTVKEVDFAKWHPVENKLLMLREDKKWQQMDLLGNKLEIESEAWLRQATAPGFQFVDMKWLREPKTKLTGMEADFAEYMSILSRSADTSRIDFIPLAETLKSDIQPIVSRAAITSFATAPFENILAVGDEKGTLGVWFVSPRFDESPRELFTLPGHRGAKVNQVSFSSDGFTILSSDSSQKSLQWRSR